MSLSYYVYINGRRGSIVVKIKIVLHLEVTKLYLSLILLCTHIHIIVFCHLGVIFRLGHESGSALDNL